MGLTKSEIFTKEQNDLACLAKALAHPARIAIIQEIMKTQSCICGTLVTEIGLAQPTISQHLRELKNAGIIQGNIEGTSVCYCINPERWEEVNQLFQSFFKAYANPKEQCC